MKHLRYTGKFLSHSGIIWRTDIMQESDKDFDMARELEFPAKEPLVIEWQREDKENVILGSNAVLKIISPGDRTYEDLYAIEPGFIRLDVYKNNTLYWSGTLDTEFYEEPYESLNGYEVSLTFSDFGILDRIKYDLSGMQTLKNIVAYAMQKSGILYGGINTDYITTKFTDGTTITDGGISVRSDNFIDEDGEVSTLYEVLEGILQPLAVRMMQREGIIYLYDLNGLYTLGTGKQVQWDGDSQTLGTDKVANNVVVSFSPYSSAEVENEIEYGGKYDVGEVNLENDPKSSTTDEYGEYYSYYPDYGDDHKTDDKWDYFLVDFTIFISPKGKGLKSIGNGCRYFHILPVTGGASECSGVAYGFRTGGHGGINTGWPKWKVHNFIPKANLTGGSEILTTNRIYFPKLAEEDRKKYKIRVMQEILIDARYNPFSGSTSNNDDGNDNALSFTSNFVFIPVKITLYNEAGEAIYHYKNKDIAQSSAEYGLLSYAMGAWVAGKDPGGDCWFEYYNPDDVREDVGIRGWKGNRHCIGRMDGAGDRHFPYIYESFKKMDDGEYLPYPPEAGYLEVQIQDGVIGHKFGGIGPYNPGEFAGESNWTRMKIYDMLRWCLYKSPQINLVNNNLVFNDAELEDVEYSGYINKSAKEKIGIDTICGTATSVSPAARGCYYRTSTGEQVQQLTRAGIADYPEKLLIGTIYSQYHKRKTTLSGEALIDGGLHYYTEQNQGDKRFLLMNDVQDVISDCTEAEYCEFRPDEYEGIEEVEDE